MANPYQRVVHYYETDQMSIVHHSNYIRWFEEARLDLMAQLGADYKALEDRHILIPVVDVSCKYLSPARYGDTVTVCPTLTDYTGVKLCFSYEVRNAETQELLATGHSTHCFVNDTLCPISIKRQEPDLHRSFLALIGKE